MANAQDSLPSRRSAQDGTSRPAAERWRKLKSQYELTPAPATRPQIEQPIRSSEPSVAPVTRATPDQPSNEFKPVSTTIPAESPTPTTAVAKPAQEAEPEWELAEPASAKEFDVAEKPADLDEKPKVEQAVPAPEKSVTENPAVEKPVIQEKPAVEEKPKPAYEEKAAVKTPAEVDESIRGMRRPLETQIPSGPLRTATQVRRIGDIAPRIQMNRDSDINKYAAEQAYEFKVKFGGEAYSARNFPDMVMQWAAPESKYYQLYFQDPALERYGHSHHQMLQPVISSARFTTQIALLPYQMAITPPWEMQSPLGWYRPGDVVPKLRYPFPWSTKAAVVEAATVTGIIFAIP
ncbi:MAG: hypothetical protein WCJ09_02945 [Planctomycetota bacterium]